MASLRPVVTRMRGQQTGRPQLVWIPRCDDCGAPEALRDPRDAFRERRGRNAALQRDRDHNTRIVEDRGQA
jgi:hypothetical protein